MTVSRILYFLLAISLASCTSKPAIDYTPFVGVSRGTPINVTAFKGIGSDELSSTSIAEYLFTGAAIGGVVGVETGFEAGMELSGDCGEFFIVCLALIPAFAAIGTSMGAMVGGVVGLAEKLPESTLNSMHLIINQYFENRPINSRFTEIFTNKTQYKWPVDDKAQTSIVLAVIGIQAVKITDDKVAFSFTTAMSVDYSDVNLNSTKPFHITKRTDAYPIEEWVAGGELLFSNEITTILSESSSIFIKLLEKKI